MRAFTVLVTVLLAALAAGPVLTSPIWPLVGADIRVVGDPQSILPAYVNSVLMGACVSFAAVAVAFYLVLVKRASSEMLIYAVAFLLIPGEMAAKGADRLLKVVFDGRSEFSEIAVFLLVQLSYVLPFVFIATFVFVEFLGRSRLEAVKELRRTGMAQISLIFRGNWAQILLIWLLGFNFSLAEAARTVILAEDVFGLGRQYFGPMVASAFAAGGVSLLLTVLALVPLLPMIPILVLAQRQGDRS